MYTLKFLTILMLFSVSNKLFAQDKLEKESRIKREDVPPKALSFIDALNYQTRIKWHKEEGLSTVSVEAKFKHDKTRFSIEFDTSGEIEDAEMEMKWSDMDTELSKSITKQLQLDCAKHIIRKTQKQYTGAESALFSLLHDHTQSDDIQINYELIVKCKEQKEVHLFEYLFSEKGVLLSKSKIVFKNSSHLEY